MAKVPEFPQNLGTHWNQNYCMSKDIGTNGPEVTAFARVSVLHGPRFAAYCCLSKVIGPHGPRSAVVAKNLVILQPKKCSSRILARSHMWGGKKGSICHFRVSLLLQRLGFQDTQILGKTA